MTYFNPWALPDDFTSQPEPIIPETGGRSAYFQHDFYKPSKNLDKLRSPKNNGGAKYLMQEIYKWMSLDNFRVVYGGRHTVLLYKKTGKRVCHVLREETEGDSLTRAILYLVLKFRDLGGKQISEWADKFMKYASLHMKPEFEKEFMLWLLEFGNHYRYDHLKVMNAINRIYYQPFSGDRLNEFLYFLCEDQFGYSREDIEKLLTTAVCSEKTASIELVTSANKSVNTFELKVTPIDIKEPSSEELTEKERMARMSELLDEAAKRMNEIMNLCGINRKEE